MVSSSVVMSHADVVVVSADVVDGIDDELVDDVDVDVVDVVDDDDEVVVVHRSFWTKCSKFTFCIKADKSTPPSALSLHTPWFDRNEKLRHPLSCSQ